MSEPANVLVVAHQTAATSGLLDAVRERAQRSPARFHLVVPRQAHGMHKVVDPQDASDGGGRPGARGGAAEAVRRPPAPRSPAASATPSR